MLDRNNLKNLPGYKKILSIGGKDTSGPVMLKTGAFQFIRGRDYGKYNITKDGFVKRQSVQAFKIGVCDMQTLSSYDKAFNDIANKMIQIEEKEKKGITNNREKVDEKTHIALKLINGEQAVSSVKLRNMMKNLFNKGLNHYKYLDDDMMIKICVRSYLLNNELFDKLRNTPGAVEFMYIMGK